MENKLSSTTWTCLNIDCENKNSSLKAACSKCGKSKPLSVLFDEAGLVPPGTSSPTLNEKKNDSKGKVDIAEPNVKADNKKNKKKNRRSKNRSNTSLTGLAAPLPTNKNINQFNSPFRNMNPTSNIPSLFNVTGSLPPGMMNPMGNMNQACNVPSNFNAMGNLPPNVNMMGNMPSNINSMANMPNMNAMGNTPMNPMNNMPTNMNPMINMPSNMNQMGNIPSNMNPMGNIPSGMNPMGNMPSNMNPMGSMPSNMNPLGNMPTNMNLGGNMLNNMNPLGNTSKMSSTGNVPPLMNLGNTVPSNILPNINCPPPNTGVNMTPNLNCPPPNLIGALNTNINIPPPNMNVPLPNINAPPPNLIGGLPNTSIPPPNITPDLSVPPPNFKEVPKGVPPPVNQPPLVPDCDSKIDATSDNGKESYSPFNQDAKRQSNIGRNRSRSRSKKRQSRSLSPRKVSGSTSRSHGSHPRRYRSRSRGRTSPSKSYRSDSKSNRSRSPRVKRSRSRGRRSSRERRSRSRGRRSRSRGRRSRSWERSRRHGSKSRDRHRHAADRPSTEQSLGKKSSRSTHPQPSERSDSSKEENLIKESDYVLKESFGDEDFRIDRLRQRSRSREESSDDKEDYGITDSGIRQGGWLKKRRQAFEDDDDFSTDNRRVESTDSPKRFTRALSPDSASEHASEDTLEFIRNQVIKRAAASSSGAGSSVVDTLQELMGRQKHIADKEQHTKKEYDDHKLRSRDRRSRDTYDMFARSPSREGDKRVTSTTSCSRDSNVNFKLDGAKPASSVQVDLKAKLNQFTSASKNSPYVQASQAANAAFLHAALAELFGSSEALAYALTDERFVGTLPVMEKIITADNVSNSEKVEMITVLVVRAQRMLNMSE